jgi:hypothetical protein
MRAAVIAALIISAIVAGFLAYIEPWHQLLDKAGFTTACNTSDCGD